MNTENAVGIEIAQNRSYTLLKQISPQPQKHQDFYKQVRFDNFVVGREDADDIVIVAAVRTPHTRARRGGLKDTPADDLVCAVVEDVMKKTKVRSEEIGDVVFGSVLGPSSQRANEVIM